MFVGHAALALAAKSRLPRLSLGWLLVATFWADILWPVLLLLGVERVRIDPGNTAFTPLAFDWYPWSHSLLMDVAWGLLGAALVFGAHRDRTAAWMFGALVVSHWVLDVISHRADMPLWPGVTSPRFGLDLWRSVPATLIVEGALFAAGTALYVRATAARDRIGSWGLAALLTFLGVAWLSGPLGPPPPSVAAIAWAGLIAGPLVGGWGAWVDAHRVSRG